MKTKTDITRILVDEVVVRARPDSVHSPEFARPLHMLPHGGKASWSTEFDEIPKLILRVETDDGLTGLGECYRGIPYSTLEPMARGLIGQDVTALNLQELPLPYGRSYDGLECALVDLHAKIHGLSASELLGGRYRERVLCGAWTGHRTIEDAARKAKEGQEAGFTSIKFKCAADDPVVEWCEAIRETCGPGFTVILDPNQRFENTATALRLAAKLAEVGNVLCLEDPIARWDLLSLSDLRKRCPIPIALHVAVPYNEMGYQHITDVVAALRLDCCDFFNFNGGFFNVKRMATISELSRKPFWHGSEVDLGILEASYLHKCAACASATLPSDIFGELVREDDLITEPIRFENGHALVPEGPGLGVELDLDALEKHRTNQWEITAS